MARTKNGKKEIRDAKKPYNRPEDKEVGASEEEPKVPSIQEAPPRVFLFAGGNGSGKSFFLNHLALRDDQEMLDQAMTSKEETESYTKTLPLIASAVLEGITSFFTLVEYGPRYTIEALVRPSEDPSFNPASILKGIFFGVPEEDFLLPRITLFSGKKENFVEDMFNNRAHMISLNRVGFDCRHIASFITIKITAPFRFLKKHNISLLEAPNSAWFDSLKPPCPVDAVIGFTSGRCFGKDEFMSYRYMLSDPSQLPPCYMVFNTANAFSGNYSAQEDFEWFKTLSMKHTPKDSDIKETGFLVFVSDAHRKSCDEQLLALADQLIEKAFTLPEKA